jgi:hypothetical protein
MASRGYMGPNEVQALIGQWVDIVGKDHDHDHDRDRDRDRDRWGQGQYQPPYQQPYQPPYQQPYQPPYGQPYQPPYGQPYQPPYQPAPYQPPYQQPYQQPYRQPIATVTRRPGVVVREHRTQEPDFWTKAAHTLLPITNWLGQELPAPPGAEGLPFPPPRAAVVAAPLPTQANRDILPMSTGVPILPTQSAQITGRPQTLVFKIGRFVISNGGTAGGSADWIVNDIKIGNRSQFVQSGDVPGDLFATNAIDTFVRFESAQTAMDVVVVVTYIGLNESGCPFFGAMVGTAAV